MCRTGCVFIFYMCPEHGEKYSTNAFETIKININEIFQIYNLGGKLSTKRTHKYF